jgi:hypothetical protein
MLPIRQILEEIQRGSESCLQEECVSRQQGIFTTLPRQRSVMAPAVRTDSLSSWVRALVVVLRCHGFLQAVEVSLIGESARG